MKTKKFIISFVVSILVFSIASVIIAMGLSQGRRNDRKTDSLNNEELEGRSVNILLVMSDYSPEKFNDYDPDWVRNVVGKSVEFPVVKPESPLNGYRKVYTENMAILRFDKEHGEMSLSYVPGATLVTVKGLQIKLEEVAGRWGMAVLTEKVHAITGLEIDHYMTFTPVSAAAALDMFGTVDYTVKCNMKYSVPERGINIDLSAGTYRLDGKTTVDMLRYNGYGDNGITRKEITFGYSQRLVKKIEHDFTKEDIRAIVEKIIELAYTDIDMGSFAEELNFILSFSKLSFECVELAGTWQNVGKFKYFVLDETKTLSIFKKYRRSAS